MISGPADLFRTETMLVALHWCLVALYLALLWRITHQWAALIAFGLFPFFPPDIQMLTLACGALWLIAELRDDSTKRLLLFRPREVPRRSAARQATE